MQIIICDDKSFTYLNNDSMVKDVVLKVKGNERFKFSHFHFKLVG
jgi:hypothetical protein